MRSSNNSYNINLFHAVISWVEKEHICKSVSLIYYLCSKSVYGVFLGKFLRCSSASTKADRSLCKLCILSFSISFCKLNGTRYTCPVLNILQIMNWKAHKTKDKSFPNQNKQTVPLTKLHTSELYRHVHRLQVRFLASSSSQI